MEERTSVLVLTTTYPRWKGDSVPSFVHHLSREIEGDEFDVTVLAPHAGGAKKNEVFESVQVRRYPYFYPAHLQSLCYDQSVLRAVKTSILAAIQVPFMLCSLLFHTAWLVKHKNIDVIHSHWLLPNGFVGALLSRVFNLPHVMTLHAGGVRGASNVPGMSVVVEFIDNNTEIVVPVSTYISESYEELLEEPMDQDRIEIQPMGADVSSIDTSQKSEIRNSSAPPVGTIGIYVGRIEEEKGIEYLLEAISQMDYSPEDFKFRIVGSGPAEESIREYVDSLGLEDIVEFTGWLNGGDLQQEYVMADFVVIPSVESESGVSEGMPTVIPEAFASMNPVIATDVGGISDAIVDGTNGILVEQRNSNQLQTAIAELVSNKYRRAELAENAAASAEDFQWEGCGEIYKELLKKGVRKYELYQ